MAAMYALAEGQEDALEGVTSPQIKQLLYTLCASDPSTGGVIHPPTLLAPYSKLIKLCINSQGEPLYKNHGDELGDMLRRKLGFSCDQHKTLDGLLRSLVSDAVMKELAACGVGIQQPNGSWQPATALNLGEVREIRALMQHPATSLAVTAFKNAVMVSPNATLPQKKRDEQRRYIDEVGVHILQWIRHVASHKPHPAVDLSGMGFPANVIDRIVNAAIQTVGQPEGSEHCTFTLDTAGIPVHVPRIPA